ncbi:DUF5926 family protein [Georgenia thermotolerans]|uniref:Topoisomerase II n=1 Tax=Georgenia thermotolerans TaxID=527326 RepID=A0A7J5UT44_9MICO|nr:DUF5926 family protein [Georgenia thermotolerans]KAE8765517.1 topoisomerase II [Georgenia thermotolerans]
MGKKSRKKSEGTPKPKRQEVPYVERPFEGLPGETDLVALREVVPAASVTVRTTEEHGAREVQLVTLLPDTLPALHREDGTVLVALQTPQHSGDASRDVAAALLDALALEPGTPLTNAGLPEPGPRLQDVLDTSVPFEVTVHDTFDYWLAPGAAEDPEVAHALEHASEEIVPTVKIDGVDSAYWVRMGAREFLRWARPEDQERVLDAIARLHAARESAIDEGSKFIGAFRACGILIPVWELAPGTEAEEIAEPLRAFEKKLEEALASDAALTADERRARAGIVSRQVSLR